MVQVAISKEFAVNFKINCNPLFMSFTVFNYNFLSSSACVDHVFMLIEAFYKIILYGQIN